ncbi:hypothetical protein B9Z55_004122 [Caenorhabditis nigoni]|uniref:Uncharacterized protein n=1 Tax=Caenorhabditis nigoni TaxID=1611254 RepID=A0A2G5UUT1_9PELO|nr:hypothetical protein B9Z55_004122 [Caenorhabditis nigoni]
MKGCLEISIVPLDLEPKIQFLIIQLSSFLFKILDPKGTKDIITQYYGFLGPGEVWKARIALRDISTEVCLTHLDDYIESPEGVLTIKHGPMSKDPKFPFRFESEQILDIKNPEFSEWSGVLKIEKEDDDWKELKENIQEMLNKRKEEGYEIMKELEETQKTQKPAFWDYQKEYDQKLKEIENRKKKALKTQEDKPPEGFFFLPGSEKSEISEMPKKLVQEEKKKSETKKILEKVEKSKIPKSEKSEKSEKIVQSKSLQSTQEATLENDTIRLLGNCNFTKNELYPVQKVNSKRRKRVEKREKEEKERGRCCGGCCLIL